MAKKSDDGNSSTVMGLSNYRVYVSECYFEGKLRQSFVGPPALSLSCTYGMIGCSSSIQIIIYLFIH